jgi:hypothetical protein
VIKKKEEKKSHLKKKKKTQKKQFSFWLLKAGEKREQSKMLTSVQKVLLHWKQPL